MRSSIPVAFRLVSTLAFAATLGCSNGESQAESSPSTYLYVWAGPHGTSAAEQKGNEIGAENFLAVIDADPTSKTYGKFVGSTGTGTAGAMAHHTELTLPSGHPLFANDYVTGEIFRFDLSDPIAPRVLTRSDSVPGFRKPHNFARMRNGNVLATMQYGNGSVAGDPGGLAEFDSGGRLIRTSSAVDPRFMGARIRPNGIELFPVIDRAVTTSMPMDDERTADVVQIWRVSDLRLLHTLQLPVIRGDSTNHYPYDVRVLADGRTGMVNTYFCDFYRLTDIDTERPRIDFVSTLSGQQSEGCAVPVVVGHYWIVPAAEARAVVSLDISDAGRPVEVSRLNSDSAFFPHWLAADPRSDRLVVAGTDGGQARVLIAHLNRRSGQLSWDDRFREAGSTRPGVSFDRREFPHGTVGHVIAHSALFGASRR